MSVPAVESRFTLRDLPFPAKLVITCFLLSVGLGYSTAMVQLHFQDSKSGAPLPLVADVVLKFTGKKWLDKEPPRPVSKFSQLILASSGTFGSNGTMLPAFFEKDPAYHKAMRGGADPTKLRGEREGERDALVLWASGATEERKKTYEIDSFHTEIMPKAITEKFKNGDSVKVKSIIEARCVVCHGKGQPQSGFPLETYEQIDKYLGVPPTVPFPPGGGWVKVEEPISLEKLTQSTHAHLLSFAVLFSLTGLVFAFTSYPTIVRCLISPLVLLAIVTDVSFWWIARLSEGYGVYFSMGVMGTGGVAGLGLTAQIVLGVWNMYGPKGKVVIALIFALGGALGGLVMTKIVMPGLEAKKEEAAAKVRAESEKKPEENKPEKKDPDKTLPVIPPPKTLDVSMMDQVLDFPLKAANGMDMDLLAMPFDKKGQQKNMVRAFFDKDGEDFAAAVKAKNAAAQAALAPERYGELAAVREWTKLPDAQRQKTYNNDAFDLPADLAKKPFTPGYLKDGKVMIKAIMTDRCIRCHADEESATFKDYDSMRRFLEAKPTEK